MNVFYIVLITLIIYSSIATIVYLITNQNEDVIMMFGLGIVGLILVGVSRSFFKIKKLFKYHIGKRSIFEEMSTGNKYKCKVKDTKDIEWVAGYKIIKRYANKFEWIDIQDFSKEFISNSKKNCNHCKYDKECVCEFPYNKIKCKHDQFGTVVEFDKFESK